MRVSIGEWVCSLTCLVEDVEMSLACMCLCLGPLTELVPLLERHWLYSGKTSRGLVFPLFTGIRSEGLTSMSNLPVVMLAKVAHCACAQMPKCVHSSDITSALGQESTFNTSQTLVIPRLIWPQGGVIKIPVWYSYFLFMLYHVNIILVIHPRYVLITVHLVGVVSMVHFLTVKICKWLEFLFWNCDNKLLY